MTTSQTSPTNLRVGLPDIAFTGKAGAGKSTAAELLTELGYRRLSFADPLREAAQVLGIQGREALLTLGALVRAWEPDAFVSNMHDRCSYYGEPLVIDDLRYENEWAWAHGEGFVIVRVSAGDHLRRDRLRSLDKQVDEDEPSERAVDHLKPDHEVFNVDDTIEFYDALVDVILKERKRR